jgi:hypothetical protein
MKNIIIISIALTSLSSLAADIRTKVKCDSANNCTKETTIVSNKVQDLKMTDMSAGKCLLDPKSDAVSYIEKVERDNIVTLEEVSEEATVVVLKRVRGYYVDRSFNRARMVVPCNSVESKILSKVVDLDKCIKSNGKGSSKVFCEKERLRNF